KRRSHCRCRGRRGRRFAQCRTQWLLPARWRARSRSWLQPSRSPPSWPVRRRRWLRTRRAWQNLPVGVLGRLAGDPRQLAQYTGDGTFRLRNGSVSSPKGAGRGPRAIFGATRSNQAACMHQVRRLLLLGLILGTAGALHASPSSASELSTPKILLAQAQEPAAPGAPPKKQEPKQEPKAPVAPTAARPPASALPPPPPPAAAPPAPPKQAPAPPPPPPQQKVTPPPAAQPPSPPPARSEPAAPAPAPAPQKQ